MKARHTMLATAFGISVLAGGCTSVMRSHKTEPECVWKVPKGAGRKEAISPERKEPRHVSYLTSVKQAIEVKWVYPQAALEKGLEGKVIVEFTILESGDLEEIQIVCYSRHTVLDEEVVRAARAASPFQPIPSGLEKGRVKIMAGFEYQDNRTK